MKPLFARFLPAIVSEQPITAVEDARTCRPLTGLHLLAIAVAEDEERAQDEERRDTLVEANPYVRRIAAAPRVLKKAKKRWGIVKRHTV